MCTIPPREVHFAALSYALPLPTCHLPLATHTNFLITITITNNHTVIIMNDDDIVDRRQSLEPMPSRMEILLSQSAILDISESESERDEICYEEALENRKGCRVTFTDVALKDDASIKSFNNKLSHVHQNEVKMFNDSERSSITFESSQDKTRHRKSQSTRITLSSHRDMVPELTSDLSEKHTMKRSTKEVIKLSHFDKSRYITTWVWVLVALSLMVIFGIGGWAFPDGGNPTCDDADAEKNATMCGMIDVIQAGTSSLAFLSGFIIAGFVSSAVYLWRIRRTAYCELANATKNLLINITTLVPLEERGLFARWSILGFELSVLKARYLIDADEGREYLELSELIVDDEWDEMVEGERHTTVWFWIQTRAKELRDRNSIDAFELQTICNAVTLSRDKANDMMRPIDRDQPPPYVFVCAILINVNLLLYSMAKGLVWSTWMNDAGNKVFTQPRFYCDILILHAYTLIFSQLFDVCALLYNPFGPRDIDIPVSEPIFLLLHFLTA